MPAAKRRVHQREKRAKGGTMRLVVRVRVGRRQWGIALNRTGSRLYVANGLSDDVSVINTSTLRVERTFPVGKTPQGSCGRRGRSASLTRARQRR